MQHPEYLYWFALAAFGVPAIVLARAVVPALAMLVVLVNILAWRAGITWRGEGLMLACLYGLMLTSTMRMRLGAAETMAAALWSPMMVCAIAQAAGALPSACYWAIYGLAMAQAILFLGAGRWTVRARRLITERVTLRRGGLHACRA
ncbi:hypothetical protein [Sphingomonas sp.]|uniref:hypothetical protein n=1 Tax=Sphingomonas sp. TaxID=28214 RepID=UPI002FD90572